MNEMERGLRGLKTRTNADFFLSVRVRPFIPRRPRSHVFRFISAQLYANSYIELTYTD